MVKWRKSRKWWRRRKSRRRRKRRRRRKWLMLWSLMLRMMLPHTRSQKEKERAANIKVKEALFRQRSRTTIKCCLLTQYDWEKKLLSWPKYYGTEIIVVSFHIGSKIILPLFPGGNEDDEPDKMAIAFGRFGTFKRFLVSHKCIYREWKSIFVIL